jgi:hypothetical protein
MRPRVAASIVVLGLVFGGEAAFVVACETGSPGDPGGKGTPLGDANELFEAAPGPPGPCTQIPMPDGGVVHMTGVVMEARRDGGPPQVIPNAMVSVEYGGLYVPWCDLSKASPYYVFGAITDDAGRFEIDVKEGLLGFHGFATNYLYSRVEPAFAADAATPVTLKLEPLQDQKKPTSTDAGFDKTTVDAGAMVTFTATLTTFDKGDPLSDENLLVEPTRSWSLELDPPSQGKKDNFPDGVWTRTFPAPSKPGTYTYWFSATTSQCITSDVITATLVVQ